MKKRNEEHQRFIRTRLPCCVCLDDVHVEVAHVRYSHAAHLKLNPGMGTKDHDYVVPLCGRHHRKQHEGNEQAFWLQAGIDPVVLSRQLLKHTGDAETCERIIRRWGW